VQKREAAAYRSGLKPGLTSCWIELAKWPAVKAYYERLRTRPSIAKAIAEEFKLDQAELARHQMAA
jgi:glutathione S-transferase